MSLVVEDVDSFVRKRGRKRRGVEVEKDGRRETKLRRWREEWEEVKELGGGEKGPMKGRKEGEGKRRGNKKYACHSALTFFS